MSGSGSNRAKSIFYFTQELDGHFLDFGRPDIASTRPKINDKQSMLSTTKTIPDNSKCTA